MDDYNKFKGIYLRESKKYLKENEEETTEKVDSLDNLIQMTESALGLLQAFKDDESNIESLYDALVTFQDMKSLKSKVKYENEDALKSYEETLDAEDTTEETEDAE